MSVGARMRTRRRAWAAVIWVAYMVALVVALFAPTSRVQSQLVGTVAWLLQRVPVVPDPWVSFTRLEVVSNALVIAPVSLLGSVLWPRVGWRGWTAYGFLGSLLVELAQGLLLAGRQASFSDVVANTAGAMLGAWLFLGLAWLNRWPEGSGQPAETPGDAPRRCP